MSSREQFEAWGMSDPDLSETLKSEVYASIAWMAWQAASKASEQRLAAVVAECAGLKSKGREVLNEACKVYEKLNATISSDSGDFMDGQTLHEFQSLLDADTPATNSFLDKPEGNYAALAAENAQMLRLLTDISENHDEYVNADEYLYAGVPMDYVSEINAYVSRDVDAENPFKETDALLAEVRASEAKHVYDSILDNPAVTDMESLVDWLEQYAKDSASFAAQLRQGAAL